MCKGRVGSWPVRWEECSLCKRPENIRLVQLGEVSLCMRCVRGLVALLKRKSVRDTICPCADPSERQSDDER